MKFKNLLLIPISIFFLFSCEVSPPPPVNLNGQNSILGDWSLTGITVFVGENAIQVTERGLEENFYKNASYSFGSDKIFRFTYSDGESYEGEYTFDQVTRDLVLIEEGEEGEDDYKFPYLVDFTETGISISTAKINPNDTDLFEDDVNGYYLFESFALLEDQEAELGDLDVDDNSTISISYNYTRK